MNEPLSLKKHYVNSAPFDPGATEPMGAESESFYRASSWRLMWWKFRRHKVAVAAAFILLAFYAMVPFVEMIAPYNYTKRHGDFLYAPPQSVHLMHEGRLVGPFVYPYKFTFDIESFRRVYTTDTSTPQPVRFLCRGDGYDFWGLVPGDVHLFCPPENGTMFLLGTDRLGRDLLSRIIYGARISLTIGIVGIAVSFTLGLFFGGLAGYLGGWVDHVIQRLIEILRSLPELPLWLALSAALPANWSPDPRLFRHHDHPRPARLAGPRAGGALEAAVVARRGFRESRGIDGRIEAADHLPPPHPELHEPPDRVGDAVDPVDDPRRDSPVLPRARPAPSHHLLGRPAERGAEPCRGAAQPVAALPDLPRRRRRAGVQLHGRRIAGRGGSISLVKAVGCI